MLRKYIPHLILILIGTFWGIPLYALIVGSFKNLSEVMSTPILQFPTSFNIDTFIKVAGELIDPLINTIVIVIPISIIATLIGSFSAYSIYRYTSKLSDTIIVTIAIATYIPYQATLVPLVDMIKTINLYNTLSGIALAFLIYYTPMATLLMTIFLGAIPSDLINAAEVDGASEFRIFRKIVFPLLGPAITSTIVFITLQTWNNFFIPLILSRGYENHITLKVFSYIGQSGNLYNEMFSASLMASIPPLIVFILLGRYFIRGLLVLGTGGKG